METAIKEKIIDKNSYLKREIFKLHLQITTLQDKIKEELSHIGDIVEELAIYIKLNNYPTKIFPVFSFDGGEYDIYKNIELKIVYKWEYTDVVGLTEEEFKRLEDILAS